jgi:hypothetical protein
MNNRIRSFLKIFDLEDGVAPPSIYHVEVRVGVILYFDEVLPCLHPLELSHRISMMICVPSNVSKIWIFRSINQDPCKEICSCSCITIHLIFDVHFLVKLQLKFNCHVRKLMVIRIWQEDITIPYIHLLLHPGQ